MDIEILSVTGDADINKLQSRSNELRSCLTDFGFNLTYITKVKAGATNIHKQLELSASSPAKPDIILISDVLDTKDNTSFKKNFAESVMAAEKAVNTPVPKNYWRKRNAAFRKARNACASHEALKLIEKEFKAYRKKSRVFSLGDFGGGYRGYCFMYKGIKVGVLPKRELTGVDICEIYPLAAIRIKEVFQNSAEEYPEGFSTREYIPPKTGFVHQYIPLRDDSGKEIARKCVVIVAFLVFVGALSLLIYNTAFLSVQNTQLNMEIQRIAHQSATTPQGEEIPDVSEGINWDALKDINKEIVGWITVNDTQVDYPVLWRKDDTSTYQYYLSHNYKGNYDSYGSIFVDYRCTEGTKSKNLVLHGHHMNDGSMFGELMKYGSTSGNLDFYEDVPTLRFDTPDGEGTYKIISIFKTNTLSGHGEFFNYMIGNFQNEKDFMNYVYNVRIRSLINCPVDVNEDDELITLSTCSYEFTNFRTVVVARKVRKGESAKVDVSQASVNKSAVWPDVFYSVYGGKRPKVTDFCTAYEAGEIDWYNGEYDFKEQKIVTTSPTTKPDEEETTQAEEPQTEAPATEEPTEEPTTAPIIYLTVKFINYDGSNISTQQVEYGKAAKAPEDPKKPSDDYYDYVFKGWQLEFNNVTVDMTIAPNFEPVPKEQPDNSQDGG